MKKPITAKDIIGVVINSMAIVVLIIIIVGINTEEGDKVEVSKWIVNWLGGLTIFAYTIEVISTVLQTIINKQDDEMEKLK